MSSRLIGSIMACPSSTALHSGAYQSVCSSLLDYMSSYSRVDPFQVSRLSSLCVCSSKSRSFQTVRVGVWLMDALRKGRVFWRNLKTVIRRTILT